MILSPSLLVLTPILLSCSPQAPTKPAAPAAPTVEDARTFYKEVDETLSKLSTAGSRAAWVQATYITEDTEAINAQASEAYIAAATRFIDESKKFDKVDLPPDLARQQKLLRLSLTMAAPRDPKQREELTKLAAGLEADYGKNEYCPKTGPYAGQCLDQSAMEKAFATTRDPAVLQDLWVGWHAQAPAMAKDYARFVELSNQGARDIGFADTGAMWRSNYDMTPEEFTTEVHRMWEQVRPLYESLHAYVRARMHEKYGDAVPAEGMLPAHMMGNIWAQEWSNVYPDVAPKTKSPPPPDITKLLAAKKTTPLQMVKYGENFFTSLGFKPLPETFYSRSLFERPSDRKVVCHASAWDIDSVDDLRIKMCIQVRDEDFVTIHHELGHIFYYQSYADKPYLFKSGAHDGFHEAIGDAIALSITPSYLNEIGLLPQKPAEGEGGPGINDLLREGLDKIAFLPFGLMIDEWRWKVFSGEIKPADYNKAWWELRAKYQGIAPPMARGGEFFDPGAKYHIPGNTPYVRYFLARSMQFQFYKSLCTLAGNKGPLQTCSFYNSKPAGEKLKAMLALGQSQPWPQTLATLNGETKMDAGALMEYFAPLKAWLDEQNKGVKVGW